MYNNIGDTMKDNKIDDILILKDYNEISKLTTEEILTKYHTKEEGLTNKEAQKRLNSNGKNIVIKEVNRSIFYFIFNSLKASLYVLYSILTLNYLHKNIYFFKTALCFLLFLHHCPKHSR